ncbi:hypothetical protein BH24ACT2_BH24ACT2_08930 [soil metagenome]
MLVLISFGLVLVATVLLVLGLLAGGGLGLIYASIACSVAAGIALVVATVIRRPSAESDAGPAPAGDWARDQEAASVGYSPTMVTPAEASGQATAPVPVVPAPASYTPARRPALATVGAPPAGEAGGGADDDFFPIEDYDDLEVAQILPLVPELYEDELDMVEARERETKGRAAVLARIDEARRSTSGDTGVGAQVVDEVAESDDDDFFPIEDYDDLKVAEILPLLPELYPNELDLVERYERAGKGRVSIINRLAELRDAGDDDAPELQDAPDDVAMPVMVEEDVDAGEDEEFFPIEDYDELTVGEILPLLPELYEDELDVVEDRERANKNRAVVINRLAELRDAGDDDAPSPATPVLDDDDEDEGEWEVSDEGWDQSAAAAEVEPDNEDEDVDVFPIADYDRLRVSEIRSVLPELSEEELEVVRDAERRGASRITILTAIERELGVEAAPPAKKAAPSRKASSAKKLAPARKATVKKSTAKKAAAKKVATKRAATVKKAGVKKVGTRKVGTRKVGTKRAGVKKVGVKKVGTKRAAIKRTTARRL